VNEALVNNSNRVNGNLTMVKAIHYVDDATILGKNAIAAMARDSGNLDFGELLLNKNFFRNIDKKIAGSLDVLEQEGVLVRIADGRLGISGVFDNTYAKEILKQIIKYEQGGFTTLKDKMFAYSWFRDAIQVKRATFDSPLNSIKAVLNNSEAVNVLKSKGVITDLTQIEKLTTKEQAELFIKMINEGNLPIVIGEGAGKSVSPFHTIYHEMGHLQDKPRCLTIDSLNYDYSKYSDELKAWVDNPKTMQTACRVSRYASHGPGEFVAETYAKLIAGEKLPDDVLALYKQLNGPSIAGII